MKTVADRILVKPYEVKNEGGFQTLESKKRPQKGLIVSVGPDCKVSKEGDEVLYALHAGVETELEGEQYVFMRESDIYAVL
jgi:chaperonin GroES